MYALHEAYRVVLSAGFAPLLAWSVRCVMEWYVGHEQNRQRVKRLSLSLRDLIHGASYFARGAVIRCGTERFIYVLSREGRCAGEPERSRERREAIGRTKLVTTVQDSWTQKRWVQLPTIRVAHILYHSYIIRARSRTIYYYELSQEARYNPIHLGLSGQAKMHIHITAQSCISNATSVSFSS